MSNSDGKYPKKSAVSEDKKFGSRILYLLENWYTEKHKVHFTLKDVLQYKDFSLVIHPVGFLASVILFPSYIFIGMNNSIQENMLLDFRESLEDKDKFLALRYKRVCELTPVTKHFERALSYVKFRADSEYLKRDKVMVANETIVSDPLTESLVYYKRYLQNAVDVELYIRNPVKYDALYPATSVLSKLSVAAISGAWLLWKIQPHLSTWINEMETSGAQPFEAAKSSVTLTKRVGMVLMDRINLRVKAFLALAKYRKAVLGVLLIANMSNVVMWAFEERK